MAKLYNVEKPRHEIIQHVTENLENLKKSQRSRYRQILTLIPEGNEKKALDYGCGWGYYSQALAEKGYNVDAIDLSENEIEICQLVWGNSDNISYTSTKVNSLPDKSYDLILSTQVIEHVHNPGNYLSQINRILKKDRHLIISLPNVMTPRHFVSLLGRDLAKSLKKINQIILEKYDKTHDHIQSWDPIHFTRLLSTVGFQLEEFVPMEGVPFPFKKPFKPYVYTKNRRIKNLCYTMGFRVKKIRDVSIETDA